MKKDNNNVLWLFFIVWYQSAVMISLNIIIFVIICFAKFTNPIPDVLDIRRISAFRIAGSGGSSSSSCFWRGGLVGCCRAVAAASGL